MAALPVAKDQTVVFSLFSGKQLFWAFYCLDFERVQEGRKKVKAKDLVDSARTSEDHFSGLFEHSFGRQYCE